jgi:hypothetical protein
MALPQSISGTCANAKKKIGDRKKEKGMRNNLIVEEESIQAIYGHDIEQQKADLFLPDALQMTILFHTFILHLCCFCKHGFCNPFTIKQLYNEQIPFYYRRHPDNSCL